ncbi:MAG: hypothetical protein WD342_04170 [Verrucomicrobiales bacterium]
MNRSQRKTEAGRTRWIVLGALAALFVVGIVVALQWRPAKLVAKRQASLIEGIERRSAPRLQRLLADGYRDRWGFSADDAVESIVDVGSQFMTLVVTTEEQKLERDGERVVVTAILRVGGKPIGPIGGNVVRRANRLEAPFEFTWEKQTFLPSSWRLIKIDNADLPDELYGYEPGDIRRRTRGE